MKDRFACLVILSLVLLFGLTLATPGHCGITGTIRGEVTDASTGEPLAFADILISGPALLKPYGFSADKDGKFVRAGLPPGKYTVEVVYVGYLKNKITDIEVEMDRTTTITVKLTQKSVIETTVEVVAESPLIEKEVSGTSDIIDGDYIEDMPIQGRAYQNALKILPGTLVDRDQQIHVRGGRTGEVGFRVDGMYAQDPVTGGYGTNINMNAVEKMEVITGGFDAEYGGNMSGMVNVVTKSGTDTLHGSVHYNYQHNSLDGVPYNWRFYNPGFTLKGPIVPEKLNYFIAFEIEDSKRMFPAVEWPQDDFSESAWLEMGGNAKFTWQLTADDKIVIQYFFNFVETKPATDWIESVHMYKMKFDSSFVQTTYQRTFSPELLFEAGAGIGRQYLEAKVEGQDWSDYEPLIYMVNWDEGHFTPEKQYGAKGDYINWQWREVYYGAANASLTWAKDDHRVRLGAELIVADYLGEYAFMPYYFVTQREYYNPDLEQMRFYRKRHFTMDYTDVRTNWGAAYLQDRWDLEEKYDLPVFLNYGLRFDWQEATDDNQLSPRLGITYTPDERTKIRAHYGWFFQVLNLGTAVSQPYTICQEYGVDYTNGGVIEFDYYRGTEGLSSPVSKTFEFGVEREIFPEITLDVAFFDKDMQDLIEMVDTNPDPAIYEWQLMNVAGAWARGLEVKVKKAFSKRFEARLGYTYQEAKSIGIDPWGKMTGDETWLDWDLRHAFTVSFNAELPYDFFINGIYSWASGYPYTREFAYRDEETDALRHEEDQINGQREPYTSTFDLTVLKEFQVRDYTLSVIIQSYNLFDHRNVSYMDVYKGKPAAYDPGRRLLFGMKFEF